MKNCLLITIDTCRYDSICESITPNIHNWKQDKWEFTNCHASSSWTRSSFGSLLTGLYPHKHRSIRNCPTLDDMHNHKVLFDLPIKEDIKTLPEILLKNGYITAAAQGNTLILNPTYNFDKGFCVYSAPDHSQHKFYPDAEKLTDYTLEILQNLMNHDSPFFLWVNYMDPHCPYYPPQRFQPYLPKRFAYFNLKFDCDPLLNDKEQLEIYSNYQKEISYVDEQIGILLEKIPEETVIILTSDHGEEFWDHNSEGNRNDMNFYRRGIDHGHTLYEELIHVPLVIDTNSEVICRKDWLVRSIDIFPTVLELLGLGNENEIDGESLIGIETDRSVFSENLLYGKERKSAITNIGSSYYKVIFDKNHNMEIYELGRETIEVKNPNISGIFDSMIKAETLDFFDGESDYEEPDEKVIRRLKGLGYL